MLLWMLLFLLLSVIMMIYSGHLEISIKFLISFLGRKEPSPDIQKAHKVSSKIIVKWPTHRHILMSFWGSRKKKSKRHLDRKVCWPHRNKNELLSKVSSATPNGKANRVISSRAWRGKKRTAFQEIYIQVNCSSERVMEKYY